MINLTVPLCLANYKGNKCNIYDDFQIFKFLLFLILINNEHHQDIIKIHFHIMTITHPPTDFKACKSPKKSRKDANTFEQTCPQHNNSKEKL